jgi:hypothetical protein
MFQRIRQYPLMTAVGRVYRPRAYANPQPGGWEGWLVFFPVDGGRALASNRETTQSSFDALVNWAANVTAVYLAGALERALRIEREPPVLADLALAEYEALEDAERLEEQSAIERETAALDAEAAASARETANDIHRERQAAEDAITVLDDIVANPRAVAANTSPRRRKRTSQKKRPKHAE